MITFSSTFAAARFASFNQIKPILLVTGDQRTVQEHHDQPSLAPVGDRRAGFPAQSRCRRLPCGEVGDGLQCRISGVPCFLSVLRAMGMKPDSADCGGVCQPGFFA